MVNNRVPLKVPMVYKTGYGKNGHRRVLMREEKTTDYALS
jgi:hypothetical protein